MNNGVILTQEVQQMCLTISYFLDFIKRTEQLKFNFGIVGINRKTTSAVTTFKIYF